MIRLTHINKKNTPEEYDRIYEERKDKVDWQDNRRWKAMMKYHKEGDSILDIGCLDSPIPNMINYMGSVYLGTDITPKAIVERNEQWFYVPQVNFILDNILDTKIDRRFDYVLMGEVLEHLEEPAKAVNNAFQLVAKGGYLVISVPYQEILEPGAVDGDRHLWSFDKKDFKGLGKTKFKILRSQYFPYRYCFKQLIIYIKK